MSGFSTLKDAYVRFVDKQGFPIIVTVCVAVITASALWANQQEEPWVAPTPPAAQDISAAQLLQQSLRQARSPTPAPTTKSAHWLAPLEQIEVLTPYSSEQMVYSGVTGIWAIHDSIDLAADRGTRVLAMADGIVSGHGKNELQGVWVEIDHGSGITAHYAGMALGSSFITGDKLRRGDVIGYSGSGLLDEGHMAPHLHLRVTRDGKAIDPVSLWGEAE